MVMAMRLCRKPLSCQNAHLKRRDATAGILSGNQKADCKRPEADCLVAGIDAEVDSSCRGSPIDTKEMLMGALSRVPAQTIHRRIISELNAAGFEELRVPHMAVLQFPGPDGVRPGTLAKRAGVNVAENFDDLGICGAAAPGEADGAGAPLVRRVGPLDIAVSFSGSSPA
jgi:hypothetical protein